MPEIDQLLNLNQGFLVCAASVSAGPKKYFARLVTAGRILNSDRTPSNIELAAAALQRAVEEGKFENKAVFVDHAGWFDSPSLTRLVGSIHDASFDSENNVVNGVVLMMDTEAGRLATDLIEELIYDRDHAVDVGLSMVFFPVWDPNRDDELRVITGVKYIESVDLVFAPAADGRILQALSSHSIIHCEEVQEPLVQTLAPHAFINLPEVQESLVQTLAPHPFINLPNERNSSMSSLPNVPPIPVQTQNLATQILAPPSSSSDPQVTQLTLDSWAAAAASAAAIQVLAASGLPKASQDRLASHVYTDPDQLSHAIEAERSYLATLAEANVIQIGGVPPRSPQVSGMLTSLDRIQLALDAMLMGLRPSGDVQPLTGIRELYHLLSGDYEMSGVFHPDRIQFANVSCATMAGMVANALNKVVVREFSEYPQWWMPITLPMDFATLQQVKWITLGGVGELPTVTEGAAYTELTWDDQTETAAFLKKGGYLGITLEAIDKDDTGRLLASPRALAQAAWLTLAKAISSIFTETSGTGPLVSDGTRLFTSGHGNLGATALSPTTWAAARLAMRTRTEVNSGERLGALCAPKYLLVPPDLEITGLKIMGSELDYSYALANAPAGPVNPFTEGADAQARMNYARDRVIVVDLWTDTSDWAAVADPRLYPTIGIGYRYGRVPEVFSVASPTAGLMFTNDTMPVKVRFFFATGPMDYRGLYKANV